jgi:cytochrome c553
MRRLAHPGRTLLSATLAAAAIEAALAVTAARADEARTLAFGRHLARECSTCHRTDGVDNGIPSITGWAAPDFVATMEFYRTGERPNPAMRSVAQSLSEEELHALAAYYGSLPKPPRRK